MAKKTNNEERHAALKAALAEAKAALAEVKRDTKYMERVAAAKRAERAAAREHRYIEALVHAQECEIGIAKGFFSARPRNAQRLSPALLRAAAKLLDVPEESWPSLYKNTVLNKVDCALRNYVMCVIRRVPVVAEAHAKLQKAKTAHNDARYAMYDVCARLNDAERCLQRAEWNLRNFESFAGKPAADQTEHEKKVAAETAALEKKRAEARRKLHAFENGQLRLDGFPAWPKE